MLPPETSRKVADLDRDAIAFRIRRILERRAAGDVPGMFEYAAPNIVYRLGSWRGYPFQATREGKQACMEMAHAINIAYENLGSVLHHLLIDGQDVALCRTVTVRNRGSGAAVSYEVWNYARFEDGLVVEFSEFPDTEATALLDLPL